MSDKEVSSDKTIDKTIVTARLFPGFWDRWVAHGMEKEVAHQFKLEVTNLQEWIAFFDKHGNKHNEKAELANNTGNRKEAKWHYRLSALYFNLSHWIFPEPNNEKREWYQQSLETFAKADELLVVKPSREKVVVEDVACYGRVRIPFRSKGSIIIINPIDSTKEELFSYEQHFVDLGFATFTFDGPGQGETYTFKELQATTDRWQIFLDEVITFANEFQPENDLYLFGTSSGAMWSIKGSEHPKVSKAVAVSPAVSKDIAFPEYFSGRMSKIGEKSLEMLPDIGDRNFTKPVLIFHGKKDVLVKEEDIYSLYYSLPEGKYIMEYPDEGHCCNYRLKEIRELSKKWLTGEVINDIRTV
ncbi:alpha/beta hydrolase [Gracilibacillus sp. D59]|uniref:alpha/beta hydrolase n=1 Tax=Gracilibacillus sp. D59 TaxID=3457434 RepID=UPI003FCE5A19